MINEYALACRDAFFQCEQICRHKTRIDNPILSHHDGSIYQLRGSYEKFHVDVGDIERDMVEPKEVEVDMTKALAAWEAEQAGLK